MARLLAVFSASSSKSESRRHRSWDEKRPVHLHRVQRGQAVGTFADPSARQVVRQLHRRPEATCRRVERRLPEVLQSPSHVGRLISSRGNSVALHLDLGTLRAYVAIARDARQDASAAIVQESRPACPDRPPHAGRKAGDLVHCVGTALL